jgi:hypothetical protein
MTVALARSSPNAAQRPPERKIPRSIYEGARDAARALAADDEVIRAHLTEASGRVSAIGRAYERLSYDADLENINLGPYLQEVCADAIAGPLTASSISTPSREFSSTPIERFRWL